MEKIAATIAVIFGITIVRYFVLAGVPFFIFYKLLTNWYSRSKIQNRNADLKDFKREIFQSTQTAAVFALIGYLVAYSPLRQYTQLYSNINDYSLWWIPVSLLLSLVLHDTYFYWMHRLLHHKKLFKLAHVTHHQSTNPSPFASYSFHFIEAWTEGIVLAVIVMVLPMHSIAITSFIVVGFIINVYGHLGYEIAPKWLRNSFLFEIVNTSVHHNLHHSKFKGNYGLYFRIWDRVLKTEHPDYVKDYDRVQQNRFGTTVVAVKNESFS
ncbi:sterol desaturase [Mucilaginibacter sp. PAMC 26640]|nr:sterol desaturase [Mucilaginibacter sp. PAMC 26640]